MARVYRASRCTSAYAAFLFGAFAAAQVGWGAEAMPNSSKECAICHIRWVRAFDRNSPEAGAAEAVMERQAGSGDMCLSCHDGSVVDSRFKIWSTTHHTTGAAPSAAVKIPTDRFPLDAQGHMTCATCHTAHAVPKSSDLRTVVFLRQPNVDSSLCLSCHPEHAQKNKFQHPLGYVQSPVPEVILKAGGKASDNGHGIICQTCHEPHGARNAWMLVLPPSELCIACHTAKSPEAKAPAGAPVHSIGHTYPGFKPPASLLEEKATFGPGGELSCLSCHRLHDASGAEPLLIRKNEDSSLCLDCHPDESAVLGSAHDLRVSSPATINATGQDVSASGPCGACHRIHGWAREVPNTGRPHSSGCMECHQMTGPGSVHRPYVEAHPVGIPLPDGMSVSLPVDADTNTIGCLTCHDPHVPRTTGDVASASVISPETRSRVPTPRSFLRAEGSRLCILCHSDMAESLSGAHDPAEFGPAMHEALGVHPSVGSCRVCHTTHNAQGPHLWARAPAESSVGSTSGLCGACHDETLVNAPKGTHHPLGEVDSRAGLSELLLGNTAKESHTEGEIACITCHDPHGDPEPVAQLRDTPVTLCTKCHADKRGVIASAHDPGTTDWAKQLAFVSRGACVDCHPIHGPQQESELWTALGMGDPNQQLCEACHRLGSPGQVAETPHLGKVAHTEGDGASTALPGAPSGAILCSTCHDIHHEKQPPKLLRRQRQTSDLCLACHPEASRLLGTLHDFRVSVPDLANVHEETADESGPCGACHLIHPWSLANSTWAHPAMSGRDFGASYCTTCHRPGACAENRVPSYLGHPDVCIVNRTRIGDPEYKPTFDVHGNPSPEGAISCLTCHQPHGAPSTHQDTEEDVSLKRMFLRTVGPQSLCVDCHGIQTLWRYLYYHRANRNPYPKRDSG